MVPIFHGTTRNGRLVIPEPAHSAFEHYLRGLDGQEIEIAVRRRSHVRTLDQNSYYHGVIVKLIANHTGHTSLEIHEHLKQKFLPDRGVESTTELSTSQFVEYCDRCVQLAAELGISIPAPGTVE